MSLFTKKKIYVASTCYNLAGDVADRPDYLKNLVVGQVVAGDPKNSLGDVIRNGLGGGPGAKLRSFYRWADTHYNDAIGLEMTGVAAEPELSAAAVAAHIPVDPGKSISVQSVSIDPADYGTWAEQWMLANHANLFDTDWVSDFNEATGQITVTLADLSTHTFVPAGFDKNARYIVAAYNQVTSGGSSPTVVGATTVLAPGDSFPSTAGWAIDSFVSTPHTVPEAWTETHGVYSKTDLVTDGAGVVHSIHSVMYQDQTAHDDGAGHAVLDRSWHTDTTESVVVAYDPLKIFIYKIGSGIAGLDSLVADTSDDVSGFFPPIPVRLNNVFLSPTHIPALYENSKKAYKKLVGGKIEDLVEKLADNPDLAEIDYVFVFPSVALNTTDNSSKKYLYNFFANAALSASYSEAEYTPWRDSISLNQTVMNVWKTWLDAQDDDTAPQYGTPEPSRGYYASGPLNEIRVAARNPGPEDPSFDMRITWQSIKEEVHAGLGKVGAKVGEVWLEHGTLQADMGSIFAGALGMVVPPERSNADLTITWQTGAATYKRLTIRGLVHQNYVYGGKYAETKVPEALEDTDESSFLVPLHYETLKAMSGKDTAQISSNSLFLLINSYKIVKKHWYQTGFFKFLLYVAIIVITIFNPPAGLAGASALTIATVVVTNIIVAMILFKIIAVVAIAIFGEKVGTIVAAIAAFVLMNPEAFFQNGAINLANLAHADVLLNLTNAIVGGITSINQVKLGEIGQRTEGILDDYTRQTKEIARLYSANLGDSDGGVDPLSLTGASNAFRFAVEPSSVFLSRTLMTGSDIAELSMSLVSDFASLTLNTELPV